MNELIEKYLYRHRHTRQIKVMFSGGVECVLDADWELFKPQFENALEVGATFLFQDESSEERMLFEESEEAINEKNGLVVFRYRENQEFQRRLDVSVKGHPLLDTYLLYVDLTSDQFLQVYQLIASGESRLKWMYVTLTEFKLRESRFGNYISSDVTGFKIRSEFPHLIT